MRQLALSQWMIAAAAVFTVSGDAAAQSEEVRRGLADLRNSYLSAYNSGSVRGLARLYTVDAVRMPYDAPSQTGRDSIIAHYTQSFAGRRFRPVLTFTVDRVQVFGHVAIERGRYHEELHPSAGGPPLLEIGKYVIVAREEDGVWRYETTIFNRDGQPAPLRSDGSDQPSAPYTEALPPA